MFSCVFLHSTGEKIRSVNYKTYLIFWKFERNHIEQTKKKCNIRLMWHNLTSCKFESAQHKDVG